MHRVHQEASAHQNLPVVRPRERPVARRYANSLWLAGRDNLLRILSKGRVFTALESDEGRFALSYHGLGSANNGLSTGSDSGRSAGAHTTPDVVVSCALR